LRHPLGYQGSCQSYLPRYAVEASCRRPPVRCAEQEQIMDKQAWSRQAIVAAAAVVLVAAVPLAMKAQAYPFGHRIGAGYQVTMGADGGSTVDETAPTGDGSIIIECVGFDGRICLMQTRLIPLRRCTR